MGEIRITPIWFDSLGAKSSCTMINACRQNIVIDPGVAVMHPSYPASTEEKQILFSMGLSRVIKALEQATLVIITHYHHDHYLYKKEHIQYYSGKTILAKNPNMFINESQRKRAEEFYNTLAGLLGLNPYASERSSNLSYRIDDVKKTIWEGLNRDFGEYQDRRNFLLKRGEEWFERMVSKWRDWPWISELGKGKTRVAWIDSREIDVGCFRIRFTHPLFHGIEYSRLGWVIGVVIEAGKTKLFYTSDVNGPIIEDYASLVIRENPDFLILDGPPTYLLGYTLNKINLERAIENASRILSEASRLDVMIYDHHLVRERWYRKRTGRIWKLSEKEGVRVLTAAEYLGRKPVLEDAKLDD